MQPVYRFRTLDDIENLVEKVAPLFPQEGKIGLGMRELMINAVEHGNLGITYEEKSALLKQGAWKQEVLRRMNMPEYQLRMASITFIGQENRVVLEIRDEGEGFRGSPTSKPPPRACCTRMGGESRWPVSFALICWNTPPQEIPSKPLFL